MRYISGTKDLGLYFRTSNDLNVVACGDATLDVERSQIGSVLMVGGRIIAWRSCKQTTVAGSSADSEVQAMQLTAVLGEMVKVLMESILQPTAKFETKCDKQATKGRNMAEQ